MLHIHEVKEEGLLNILSIKSTQGRYEGIQNI